MHAIHFLLKGMTVLVLIFSIIWAFIEPPSFKHNSTEQNNDSEVVVGCRINSLVAAD